MGHLAISLLGSYQLSFDGIPITTIESRQGRALLAYLVVESDRPHSRSALVGLLWPERSEQTARRNLSQVLYNLRQALVPQQPASPFLLVTRRDIRFNVDSDHSLDVNAFTALVDGCQAHAHRRLDACTPCMKRLRQASELYRGDFLTGFCLPDSGIFEEWRLLKQEELHCRVMEALTTLAAYHDRRHDYEQAAHYLRGLIGLEPWREEAHRQLMQILALGGQRTAALAQYEKCREVLHTELGVAPDEETVAVWAAIKEGELEAPTSAPSPSRRPTHNLPASTTPFFGREVERAQLEELLQDPNYRFITLVGEGGVGKTRLALAAARGVLEHFPHGAWLVPLAGIPPGTVEQMQSHVVMAVAQALEFTFAGPQDPKTQLFDYLQSRELLLVLDNFEHLVEGACLVTDLLQQASRVVALCTSRESLNCQAEYVLAMDGLPVPSLPGRSELAGSRPAGYHAPGQHEPERSLDAFASVQLFVERAHRVRGEDIQLEEGLKQVAQMCRLVAGNPLAIELAAAAVRYRPLPELVLAIQETVDCLTIEMRDVPPRHRSMRAVFEDSWQLLSPDEQRILAQLSIFRGGFASEAAEMVTGASHGELLALYDKSVLGRLASGRYELHELLRQFAAERLEIGDWVLDTGESGKSAQYPVSTLRARHSAYYLQFVAEREAALKGTEPVPVASRLRDDMANIKQAWRWAIAHQKTDAIGGSVYGLLRYYELISLFPEGIELFDQAAAALRSGSTSRKSDRISGRALCRVLGCQSRLLFLAEEYEQARSLVQEATQLAQEIAARYEEGYGHWLMGSIERTRGRFDFANECIQQALTIAQTDHFRHLEGKCLSLLADTRMGLRIWTPQEVAAHQRQALAIFRELGDVYWQARTLNYLAGACYGQNDYAQALTYWQETVEMFRQLASRRPEKAGLYNMGVVYFSLGYYAQARIYFGQALQISKDLNTRWHHANYLVGIACVLNREGNYAEAIAYGERGLRLSRQVGNTILEVQALIALGNAMAAGGDLTQAMHHYQQVLTLRYTPDHHLPVAEALVGLAQVSLEKEELSQAQRWIEQLLQIKDDYPLIDCQDRFERDLICYRVLQAIGDARGRDILLTAYDRLQKQAAQIEDEALRRSFLKNVAANREIVAERTRMETNR